ncbi:MAG TPA: hypothetical protein VF107_03100 [Burkholderiaceae bacterium]
MRWPELLASAEGNPDAQQRVLDTALAALRQIDDSRLHACVVSAVPTAQSLCQLLDAFGVTVSDDLAKELDRVSLGVEGAWLAEQRARVDATDPIEVVARLQASPG